MKPLAVVLFATLLSAPAHAITWKEFWEPFAYEPVYRYHRHYVPMCRQRVYHEEYIPGNRWRPGYVRSWYETEIVPCDSL